MFQNRALLSMLESTLSASTWLLPDNSSSSSSSSSSPEITIEVVSCILGLITISHDAIAQVETRNQAAALLAAAGGTPIQASADDTTSSTKKEVPWPFVIAAVRQVEYLVELVAERQQGNGNGDEKLYTAMTGVEAIKAAARIAMLMQGNARLLVDGGGELNSKHGCAPFRRDLVYERRRGAAAVHAALLRFATHKQAPALPDSKGGSCDVANAPAVAGAPAPASTTETPMQHRPLQPPKPRQVVRAQRLHAAAELVYVVRPVVYAALLRKYGRRAWTPWITSLGLDATSLALHRAADASASETATSAATRSTQEKEELLRRRRAIAFYLLRSPIFDAVIAGPLGRLKRGTEAYVPLVGGLLARGIDIAENMQQSYYYVNGT